MCVPFVRRGGIGAIDANAVQGLIRCGFSSIEESSSHSRRPSGLVGNLHTASAEVVSSILTKVGFVFFLS